MTFTIRPATEDDIPALARIHVESWREGYKGLVDADYLQSLDIKKREQEWHEWLPNPDTRTYIALDQEETPAGFAGFGTLRTPPPGSSPIRPLYSGEIYALYVSPNYWRQGSGGMLMKEAAKGLSEMKHKSLCLWVLEKNKRAVSFYQKMGGQRCGKQMIEVGPDKLKEICFGWRDSKPLTEL